MSLLFTLLHAHQSPPVCNNISIAGYAHPLMQKVIPPPYLSLPLPLSLSLFSLFLAAFPSLVSPFFLSSKCFLPSPQCLACTQLSTSTPLCTTFLGSSFSLLRTLIHRLHRRVLPFSLHLPFRSFCNFSLSLSLSLSFLSIVTIAFDTRNTP